MNLTEQNLWYKLKGYLPGDVSRIENMADVGMPDVNGTFVLDYWIELKVCGNKSKLREVEDLLRETQLPWMMKRGKFGALIFVIVGYEEQIVIYDFSCDNKKGILNKDKNFTVIGLIRKKNKSFDYTQLTSIIKKSIKERIAHYGLCNSRAAG